MIHLTNNPECIIEYVKNKAQVTVEPLESNSDNLESYFSYIGDVFETMSA